MSTISHDIIQDAGQVQEMCGLLDRLQAVSSEDKTTSSARVQEFKSMIANNQHAALIQKLFSETDLVFNSGQDLEIVNYFAVLISLCLKIPRKGPQILEEIVNKMQENTTEKPQVRLQIIVDLFNVDRDLTRKFTTLLAILNYARLTNQGDLVLPQFLSIDEWTKELNLTNEHRRDLSLAIIQLTKNNKQSLAMLIVYLKSFEKEEDTVLDLAFDTIQQFVLRTIKLPEIQHLDILQHRAITHFKAKPFYKLVELFSLGDCKAFKDYFSSVTYLVQSDFDYLLEKIRLLTISSLFSTKQVVPFSEISSALEIELDDVESWIVDAASRELIFVRIDQPQKQVFVRYSAKRSFEGKDWANLGTRVTKCQENLNSLLETVRRVKQQSNQSTNI